jgi:Golgi phosphoprotein 3
MLSFVEEIVLLMLDDEKGSFVAMPLSSVNTVIAGAALMDLALRNRIDTDLEKLVVTDRTPTGDDILDDVLARLAETTEPLTVSLAIELISAHTDPYQQRALTRLIGRGILREESGRFLWVFRTRRYPVVDDTEEREVKARLRQLVLTDEIPDPRDVVLVCLLNACELFDLVLNSNELDAAMPRIEQLGRMDLIGQAVTKAVAEIRFIVTHAVTVMH